MGEALTKYHPENDVLFTALKAVEFATLKHDKQERKYTREPYIIHPIRVAKMVAYLGEPFISVALLHDTIEDTATTFEELEKEFGSVIALTVLELTDPPKSAGNRAKRKEIARKQLTSFVAKTVKCADIIDNLDSIARHDPKFAKTFLEELDLLIPILSENSDDAILSKLIRTTSEAYQILNPIEDTVK